MFRSMQWGGKIFDFRQITLFCLKKRLSKQKMTIFSKNLGAVAPLASPGYAYRSMDVINVSLLISMMLSLVLHEMQIKSFWSADVNPYHRPRRAFENNPVVSNVYFCLSENG